MQACRAQQRAETWQCICSPTPMYKSKTHTCTNAVHTHTVHAGTQIDQQNTSTYSRWHWRVTVKCKPRDYSLRRWEERGGERSGGVLKRGRRRRRKERDKIGGRLICTKPGCCLSVERIWHCWLFMLFQRPPAHQRQLLILSFFNSIDLFFNFSIWFWRRLWTQWMVVFPFACLFLCYIRHLRHF